MKYKIRKGNHFANFTINRLWPFSSNKIKREIIFGKECWYPKEVVKYSGWNKLVGLTGFNIHGRSGRIVWRPDHDNEGYIKLAGYVYNGSHDKWHAVEFTEVKTGIPFVAKIFYKNGTWCFIVNQKELCIPGKKPIFFLKAFPYFGGKDTAYWDMNITILT
jgi:hypothetical protein